MNSTQAMPALARRRMRSSGQSMLEFALMLPLLLLLAVGVVELGRAIYYTIAVNNGATAGAEYGSANAIFAGQTDTIKATAVCDANGGHPPGCSNGILNTSNVTVNHGCACDSGTGTSCNPMPANGSCGTLVCSGANQVVAECVQVQTTATFNHLFAWPGLPSTYTANGNAVMRVRKQ